MAGPPPPPPPAPLPLQKPARNGKILGMSARPNSEVNFSTPFPTYEVGWPYGSLGVGPYACVILPMPLPLYQMGMNGLVQAQTQRGFGTGVFHPSPAPIEYRIPHIKGRNTGNIAEIEKKKMNTAEKKKKKKNGGSLKKEKNKCLDFSQLLSKNGDASEEKKKKKKKKKTRRSKKKKNGGSVVKKEEECNDPSLPPGIVLPMEWPYPTTF